MNKDTLSQKRRGLSSIVGALLFVVLMVAAFAVLGVALDSQTDIVDTGRIVADTGLKKQQENFIINTIVQLPSKSLQINVTNNGQNPAEIFTLVITNSSDIANGYPTQTIDIPSDTSFLPPNSNIPVDIVKTLNLKMKDTPSQEIYQFKIISSLGTIEKKFLVCQNGTCGLGSGGGSSGLFAQFLMDGPNGINTKNSTAVMFVTNTGEVPLDDVAPVISCSKGAMFSIIPDDAGTANLDPCLLDPIDPIDLAVGQTALFKWDGKVTGEIGDEFQVCNQASGTDPDLEMVTSGLVCDNFTVIDPNDCGGCGGGEGGAKLILVDDLLTRPSLFMTIPSPFGEEAEGGAVWGVNLVNPTEVNMTISKLTIVVYPPTANDNDKILVKDTGAGGGSNCVITAISPTSDWSCPKDNTLLWLNQDSPVELPARSAVEMLVKVEPGAANTDIDALIVQANVFTTLGSFGKGEGYQSTMKDGATSLVNVFLQTAVNPDRTDFHGVMNSGITEMQPKEFHVSLADMDDTDTTYIENGARLIINVPRDWTNVELNTWDGFLADTDPTPGDQRVVEVGDGSTQITLITNSDIGGDLDTDNCPCDDVKTVSFDATPPCNDIAGENQPYIMYVLADGKTHNSFPIGPLNEVALVVDYDPTLDRLTCVPPQGNP